MIDRSAWNEYRFSFAIAGSADVRITMTGPSREWAKMWAWMEVWRRHPTATIQLRKAKNEDHQEIARVA